MSNLEKFYSTDDEDFSHSDFGSLVDALDNDGELEVGRIYYEADFKRISITDLVAVPQLIERMEERLHDIVGECAEDGMKQRGDAEASLEALLTQWAENHTGLHTFYKKVGPSRKMRISESDMPDVS